MYVGRAKRPSLWNLFLLKWSTCRNAFGPEGISKEKSWFRKQNWVNGCIRFRHKPSNSSGVSRTSYLEESGLFRLSCTVVQAVP